MKTNLFHITWRLMGSLKSAAFTDIGASLGDIDHEIAVGVGMSFAVRSNDRCRLALLDDGRTLDFQADRQFVVIIDRRIGIPAEFVEVDGPRALLGFRSLPAVRPRDPILLAAGAQTPRDDLDGGSRNRSAEQLSIELVEIGEEKLEK